MIDISTTISEDGKFSGAAMAGGGKIIFAPRNADGEEQLPHFSPPPHFPFPYHHFARMWHTRSSTSPPLPIREWTPYVCFTHNANIFCPGRIFLFSLLIPLDLRSPLAHFHHTPLCLAHRFSDPVPSPVFAHDTSCNIMQASGSLIQNATNSTSFPFR